MAPARFDQVNLVVGDVAVRGAFDATLGVDVGDRSDPVWSPRPQDDAFRAIVPDPAAPR